MKYNMKPRSYEEKKKEIWLSSLTKNPYTSRKLEKTMVNTKRNQKLGLHKDCGPTKDGQLE